MPTAVFTLDDLTPGQDYYVKLYIVDTSENISTREEYVSIVDFTPPTVNLFTTTSHTRYTITVNIEITDDSGGGIYAGCSIYWLLDIETEIQWFEIDIVIGVGMCEFWNLDDEKTYVIEVYARDRSYNWTQTFRRLGYPNGQGVVVSEEYSPS